MIYPLMHLIATCREYNAGCKNRFFNLTQYLYPSIMTFNFTGNVAILSGTLPSINYLLSKIRCPAAAFQHSSSIPQGRGREKRIIAWTPTFILYYTEFISAIPSWLCVLIFRQGTHALCIYVLQNGTNKSSFTRW